MGAAVERKAVAGAARWRHRAGGGELLQDDVDDALDYPTTQDSSILSRSFQLFDLREAPDVARLAHRRRSATSARSPSPRRASRASRRAPARSRRCARGRSGPASDRCTSPRACRRSCWRQSPIPGRRRRSRCPRRPRRAPPAARPAPRCRDSRRDRWCACRCPRRRAPRRAARRAAPPSAPGPSGRCRSRRGGSRATGGSDARLASSASPTTVTRRARSVSCASGVTCPPGERDRRADVDASAHRLR